MPKPNKTVERWRRKAGFEKKQERPVDPFFDWLFKEARKGRTFDTIKQARNEFDGNK